MSQNFADILETDTLTASRSTINGNVRSVRSCMSGTVFPSTDLDVGMLCYRTDQSKLYQLASTGPAVWVLIADLTKTFISQEGGDDRYVQREDANRDVIKLFTTDDATGAKTLRVTYDETNSAYKIRGYEGETDSYEVIVDKAVYALNSDKLDGQDGTYYRNANNLNAGTVPDARLPTNAIGSRTVSTADPSGGSNNDIWFKY